MIVDGWGLQLTVLSAPVCGRGVECGAAGQGHDLQGPLGDGGQMGVALFIRTDEVRVVPKKASVALQGDARFQWETKAMFLIF